ncbi:hypothetical protein AB0E62_23990 [Streptomyces sp. NPDC038707]|uniref:hypothetical protein n=1 Tax=Streptomyces sp. NPDC038707 TaxID=3154329 RepID=UPI0033F8FC30
MEQRIGSSSKPSGAGEPPKAEPLKVEPVLGAGFDPAFVPGITAPAPAEAGPVSKEPSGPEAAEEVIEEAGETVAEASAETPGDSVGESPESGDGDGPVFEAADRRARIVADRRGVRLSLDEEACEFRWDEIAAVETETARFGKRFTVTVHTPDRRWFPIEIEAPARARFKEWDERLDAVLDAYFEEA